MPIVYRQEFEVEGSGDFPMDMLRYDSCYPAREGTDTANLVASRHRRDRLPTRRIMLRRLVTYKHSFPTTGRWASFGWKVLEDTIKTSKI